ncbi:MAG TPA: MFS transporter [Dehalococcoidia bacterium]|jgi:MFS family permease|nr:MFS transporter [Dehalococcoidia bacterium]
MGKHQPPFYGWVIVGIATMGMMLVYGTRHSFSVFFPPILQEFGWSRGSTALMLSLNIFIYGLTAPVAGSLADRWKPRLVVLMGILLLALAMASCAFANELWHFYLLFGLLMPIGTACSGWPMLSPVLANWFSKRRGLVFGLSQMGGGLSFTYGLFMEFIISQFGWRQAYFVLAGVLGVIMLPIYFLFFRYRPEDKGLRAYGSAEPHAGRSSAGGEAAGDEWTLGRAMRTYQLWFLVTAHALYWGVGSYLVLAHQIKFAEDVGYSSTFATSVFALFGISLALGQLMGAVSDWIGREKTVTLAIILSIGALVALISVRDTSQPWLLYFYAIGFGLGAGLLSPTLFAGAADIFYGRHFGAISGLILTGFGIGGIIGPWLGGHIYDISGSYLGAFVFSMVCFAVAGLAFWIAAPRRAARLRPKV